MVKPISEYGRPSSIRLVQRLASLLVLAVLATGAVMGILVWRHEIAEQRDRAARRLPQVLSHSQENLEDLFRRARTQLDKVANDAQLNEELQSSLQAARHRLLRSLGATNHLDALLVTDGSGRFLISAHSDAITAQELDAIAAELNSHVSVRRGALIICASLGDAADPTETLLAGVVSAPRVAAALQPHVGGGHIYLVDDDGQVLTRSAGSPPLTDLPLAALRSGGSREPIEYSPPGDGPSTLQIRLVPQLGVNLVVTEPQELEDASLRALLQLMALCSILLAAAFAIPAILTGSGISRGLALLSDGARRAALGDLVEVAGGAEPSREMAPPIRNFNVMVRRLRHNQEELWEQNRRLRQRYETLQGANEALEQLSITDGLTKLHNHRYFQEALSREISRASRIGEPLSMLLIDIDDFKKLNDCYGHATGDEVLIRIARILNQSVRDADILARYGGEEFVILAANTDLAGAVVLANKICVAVASASIMLRDPRTRIQVTVSIGVSEYRKDRKAFFHAADQALYSAKHAGKNCVQSVEGFDL